MEGAFSLAALLPFHSHITGVRYYRLHGLLLCMAPGLSGGACSRRFYSSRQNGP